MPMIEVWNKWDLLDADKRRTGRDCALRMMPMSADFSGHGRGDRGFAREPRHAADQGRAHPLIVIPASDGARIAWLHAHGEVLGQEEAGSGENGPLRRVDVRLTEKEFGRFEMLGA